MNTSQEIYDIINFHRYKYLHDLSNLEEIRNYTKGLAKLKVLDIGCGNGRAAYELLKNERIDIYTGVDLDSESLKNNIFSSLPKINYTSLQMDLRKFIYYNDLKVLRNKFDVILVLGDVFNLLKKDNDIIPLLLEKLKQLSNINCYLFFEYYDFKELKEINYSKDIYKNDAETICVEYFVNRDKLTTLITFNEGNLKFSGTAIDRKKMIEMAKKASLHLDNTLTSSKSNKIIGNPIEIYRTKIHE